MCNNCKVEKHVSSFSTRPSNGRSYLATFCRDCKNDRARGKIRNRNLSSQAIEKARLRKVERRLDADKRAAIVLEDCKYSDRKKGRVFDLSLETVSEMLDKPCFYCEDSGAECMTLDRVDNSLGHVEGNVVQACYRCNFTRGSMPFQAWLHLREGMKSARLAGAFQDWRSKPINRR